LGAVLSSRCGSSGCDRADGWRSVVAGTGLSAGRPGALSSPQAASAQAAAHEAATRMMLLGTRRLLGSEAVSQRGVRQRPKVTPRGRRGLRRSVRERVRRMISSAGPAADRDRRALMYRRMTLALAVVAVTGVAGCGSTPERLNARQQRNVDRTPPEVYAMPDHYNNVASKCDGHGHRMYVTSNKDQAPSNLVVVTDESCSR
jgi:hypothetical protein